MAENSNTPNDASKDDASSDQNKNSTPSETSSSSLPNRWPPFNPFIRHPVNTIGKLKMLVFGSILVPIRVTGALCTLTTVLAWSNVFSLGVDTTKPYSPFRRRILVGGVRFFSRLLAFFYGYLWFEESHEITDPIERQRIEDESPPASVIVCNHIGFVELLYLVTTEGCCFVAKADVQSLPFIGRTAQALQSLFVDRTSGNGKSTTTERILERARAKPGTWPPLAICPEGTTTNGHTLVGFHTGAFLAGVPVRPVVLRMPFRPGVGYDPSFTCANIFKCVLGLMTQPWNRCQVVRMRVYVPNEEEKKDPRLYANNVRDRMADVLGVRTYPLGWVDKLPFEPSEKSKALGKKLQMKKNGGVLPSPPVFTEDPFGNSLGEVETKKNR